MAELAPGSQFGAYRIESLAGQGGMGVVYKATQIGLDRLVALKVVAPAFAHDEEFRARFQRESKLAASIEHPNVIPVYEAGEQDGTLFLAMRFVDGTDLKSLLNREQRLEPRRAAGFVGQIAAALDAAHAAGLVHRDVKPANALLASQDHVYLTDFGLTKRAASGSAMTKTGQMVGTVDYVAPEQVEGGSVDARTDVYSLACVLYHLLTGHVPFDKPTEMAKLFAHVHEDPPRPADSVPGLPPALNEVVWRGMAKDPSKRYLSAGDLGRAALAAGEHRELAEPERSVARGEAAPGAVADAPTVTKAVPPTPAPAGSRRSRRPWALGAAALAALGVIAALALGGGGDDGDSSSSGGGIAGPVTRAGALDAASSFAQGVDEQNLSQFEDLYRGNFSQTMDLKTCTGASQPMDLDAALGEWQCLFGKADDDEMAMTLANQRTDAAKQTLTADYSMSRGGDEFASGKVSFHLIRGVDFPRMDKVVFSDGDGTFTPGGGGGGGSGSAGAPITRATGINTAKYFADYYEDENLQGLESRFVEGFEQTDDGETCTDAKQPMGIDAALEEYQCWFDSLEAPEMRLSSIKVDPAKKVVTADYRVIDKKKAVRIGKLALHLVPSDQKDQDPNIDRVTFSSE